jgi:outer membrane receptor protein involved in Fe transport
MKLFTFLFLQIALIGSALANSSISDSSDYQVVAKKLNKARSDLSPKTGSSVTSFSQQAIANLPQGQASSLSQVLLRAPNVSQDSYGQLHVRGDHSNLQYRINDVIVPEGISGFGSVLDARFADSVDLLTGALPAQYGYRTAGIVEIKTKDQGKNLKQGGYSEIITGSNDTAGFNQQLSGSQGKFNYFLSASYLQNNRGLESPTGAKNSLHNDTKQDKIFFYGSYLLNNATKISTIFANATNRFEIPNNPNQEPQYNLQNQLGNSATASQRQQESNRFAILSLQQAVNENIDYQLALFTRHSDLKFRGDSVQDIIFSGVASNIDRSSLASGIQADASFKLNEQHKLTTGLYFSNTAVANKEANLVLPVDANGDQTSNIADSINGKSNRATRLYSIYLQDEYRYNQDLLFNFGGRFDAKQAKTNEQQFSPRLGTVYNLNSKTKVHAGYAKYFTAPKAELMTEFDHNRFADTSNQSENNQNNNIRSEKTNYYDVGLAYKASEHLNFAFDAYYKDIKNMLDEGQFGNALIFKPFNYAKAKSYGLEFTTSYQSKTWQNYLNLAWQQSHAFNLNSSQYLHESAEIERTQQHGVRPDHDQRITASAGIAYNFLQPKITIGGDALFGSGLRRGEANTQKMPSYAQFNVFATKKIQQWQIRLAVNNLLDKSYRLRDGSGIGISAPQYAARRTAYVLASYEF